MEPVTNVNMIKEILEVPHGLIHYPNFHVMTKTNLVQRFSNSKGYTAAYIPNRYRPRFFDQVGHQPRMHLWKISISSLNNAIVRPTKIMNRADKKWAHF